MKVVLLNSGGKEALAAGVLLQQGKVVFPAGRDDGKPLDVLSLYLDLGWRNSTRAANAAYKIAFELGFKHEYIDIGGDWLKPVEKSERDEAYHQVIVLHVLAAMHAAKKGASVVVSGMTAGPVEPGTCFSDGMRYLYTVGNKYDGGLLRPEFVMPLMGMSRDAIAVILRDNYTALYHTVSCEKAVACNACIKCRNRVWMLIQTGQATMADMPPPVFDDVTPT